MNRHSCSHYCLDSRPPEAAGHLCLQPPGVSAGAAERHHTGAAEEPRGAVEKHQGRDSGPVDLTIEECQLCTQGEWCDVSTAPPTCIPCSSCPSGYKSQAQCSGATDTVCVDIDECAANRMNNCEKDQTCVNVPGSFYCMGKFILCGPNQFYNRYTEQCQKCRRCMGDGSRTIVPCHLVSDTLCSPPVPNLFSALYLSEVRNNSYTNLPGGDKLKLRPIRSSNDSYFSRDPSYQNIILEKAGFTLVDINYALKHTCANYMQLSVDWDGVPEAGTRLKQTVGRYYQSSTVSTAMAVTPGETLGVEIRSNNRECFPPGDRAPTQLKEVADVDRSGPLSILWLSHKTGAALLKAFMQQATYEGSWRVDFELQSISDPYMLQLKSSNFISFRREGNVRFSFHQSMYLQGLACSGPEGVVMVPKLLHRGGGTVKLLQHMNVGVNMQYMTLVTGSAVPVQAGDRLFMEIESARDCTMYFLGSDSGIGGLNVLWLPHKKSAVLMGELYNNGQLEGVAQRQVLRFTEKNNTDPAVLKLNKNGRVTFLKPGRVNVNYHQNIIHSCDYASITAYYQGLAIADPVPFMQQVLGNTNAKAEGIYLSGSYDVEEGSQIYLQMTCKRGRINGVGEGHFSTLSVLWIMP
ncbi:Hypp8165 [Branchiostoma lanceolatum]|uniref:Hypp8165 protein n=1 Tax=Branchiostoma lanceolatum TaxID=7740 RepID=A0A8J9Z7G7_BRALA|nr:Hypp8165 [Branchiostoma lanceolatum]